MLRLLKLTEKVETRGRVDRSVSEEHCVSRSGDRRGQVTQSPGLSSVPLRGRPGLSGGCAEVSDKLCPCADGHPSQHTAPRGSARHSPPVSITVSLGNTPWTAGCLPHGIADSPWVPVPCVLMAHLCSLYALVPVGL